NSFARPCGTRPRPTVRWKTPAGNRSEAAVSSDDYLQVSTILSRLKRLSEFFLPGGIPNPVRIAELISDVLDEISTPPPGDPDTLEELARAYRSAADVIALIGTDTGRLGTTTLPAAWEGG